MKEKREYPERWHVQRPCGSRKHVGIKEIREGQSVWTRKTGGATSEDTDEARIGQDFS